jgi:phenylpropionate dioxygenase-like ring-hydroxylating dioxygenase large terminal subunit
LSNTEPALRRAWHPVARCGEVTTDVLDVVLLGESWRVWRVADGAVRAERAGRGGGAPHATTEHLGHVYLAPEEPLVPLLDVPEWDEPDRYHVPMPRFAGPFGAGLLVDNQFDTSHFAFVHRGTFGSPDAARIPVHTVERDGWSVTMHMQIPIQAPNDPLALAGDRPLDQYREMVYRYRAPLALALRLDYPIMGGSNVIVFSVCPQTDDHAWMDVDLLFSQPGGFTPEQLDERLAFENRVLAEDIAVQRRYRDLRLPLDLTTEVHTKADRYSVECRRALAEFVTASSGAG